MNLTDFLIPAIDIRGGKVVRLLRGDFDRVSIYSDDPVKLACLFQEAGFRRIHVVDLDGAEGGKLRNYDLIKGVREVFRGEIQVGGGIRSYDVAESLFKEGIDYLVIGTLAIRKPEEFVRIVEDFPGRIVLSLDSKGGRVAVEGWKKSSGIRPEDLTERFEERPIWGYLYTVVDRDGTLGGVDPEPYKRIRKRLKKPILASGGVSSVEDIKKLEGVVEGVVVGRAIYEGRIPVRGLGVP
ncbi:MAG: 1-(5-phosphoribosyl)-5-[(5-phosphoribosylamino)methylideneamino]imidazole-4-carboxamide isomerase [Aquificota bacterium]|nr:1-(5-phosphoribosyl)-5-[(5-phosphoribosylamino)methylideneamino]imidazole-4-carboxamide isomerase [Aquificota bacterium]MDQ7083172.1 1-(5-phosphoribosyl)-5-[(5-phosphoribosylamino)methylideneamino]imidazole-4-carboxamide isomerase [Aquificota bacterium]